jgi:hypothetical protein
MTDEGILAGIRDANYQRRGIRCLQLFRADESYFSQLQTEVKELCRAESGSRVGSVRHITNWTRPHGEVLQFTLLNASGRYDDFSVDHDLSCFGKRFHGSYTYPAVARIIDTLPHTVNFRVNVLGPGASLSPHKEHTVIRTRAGSVALRTRFHLPICTNPGAEIMLDGDIYRLEVGTVYFVNHGCVHSARNGGDQDRVHLVWDMLLTREAFEFMFTATMTSSLLRRIKETDWAPTPVRSEEVGYYEQIAPLVTEDQASRIGWCEVQ